MPTDLGTVTLVESSTSGAATPFATVPIPGMTAAVESPSVGAAVPIIPVDMGTVDVVESPSVGAATPNSPLDMGAVALIESTSAGSASPIIVADLGSVVTVESTSTGAATPVFADDLGPVSLLESVTTGAATPIVKTDYGRLIAQEGSSAMGFSLYAGYSGLKKPFGAYMWLPNTSALALPNEPLWDVPEVTGAALYLTWDLLEPTQGTYDFSVITTALALCHKYNRSCFFEFDFGANTPGWLQAQTLIWESSKGPMPAPWDSVFVSNVNALIAALGQFDSDPALNGVCIWCGGKDTECFFADTTALTTTLNNPPWSGIGPWLTAAENIIGQYQTAFPTTQLYIATGDPAVDNHATMDSLANLCLSKGIGLSSNGVSPNFPGSGTDFPHTLIPWASRGPNIGYQWLGPVQDARMLAAGGNGTLAQMLEIAQTQYFAQWVQIYRGDVQTDPGGTAAAAFNAAAGVGIPGSAMARPLIIAPLNALTRTNPSGPRAKTSLVAPSGRMQS